jgi:hypothetical protein
MRSSGKNGLLFTLLLTAFVVLVNGEESVQQEGDDVAVSNSANDDSSIMVVADNNNEDDIHILDHRHHHHRRRRRPLQMFVLSEPSPITYTSGQSLRFKSLLQHFVEHGHPDDELHLITADVVHPKHEDDNTNMTITTKNNRKHSFMSVLQDCYSFPPFSPVAFAICPW